MDNIRDFVSKIVKESTASSKITNIDGDTSLRDEGMDSLDIANIFLSLEERFKIKIPDEDVEKLVSMNEIVRYIQEKCPLEN